MTLTTGVASKPSEVYYVGMNITLSVDERLVRRARKKADALGTSLNQLAREYLERLAGSDDAERDVAELRQLSRAPRGGCSVLYSEDLQHGRSIDGVRIVDPSR